MGYKSEINKEETMADSLPLLLALELFDYDEFETNNSGRIPVGNLRILGELPSHYYTTMLK